MAAIAETCEENGLTELTETEIASASIAPAVANETGFVHETAGVDDDLARAASAICDCATDIGITEGACGAEHSDTSSICSNRSTDLDSMPQWKRDLIQRRKTNIARTIGANQITCCSKQVSDPPALISTSPVVPLTKTISSSSISGSSSNNSLSSINTKSSSSQSHSSNNVKMPALNHQSQQEYHGLSSGHYTAMNSSSQSQRPQTLSASNASQDSQSISVCNSKLLRSSVGILSGNQSISSSITGEPVSMCNCSSSSETCSATLQPIHEPQQQLQPDFVEHQQPFQYQSRHEIEKSPSSCGVASGVLPSSSLFVKNPSVSKTCKNNNKYKSNTKASASGASQNNSVTNLNAKKMVAAQDINETTNIDFDFDPSEELQYGPGIVSKLRCRYLSLALRQSAGKQRPPLDSLRRATSLNNLLDDDEDSNSSCLVDHVDNQGQKVWNNINSPNNTTSRTPDEFVATFQKNLKLSERDKRSRQIKRGNDSLKRARSVEALLVCDKSWENEITTNGVLPATQIYKKGGLHKDPDCISVQGSEQLSMNSSAEITIEDKISNARERIHLNDKPPKRLTSIIDDTERPPPDLVKQTLKIFEATANRRGRGLSRNNFSGEVAAKVASYKSIISQEKPPIVFPKPPLSPKKHFRKPGNLDIVAVRKTGQQTIVSNNKKSHPLSPVSNITNEYQTPPHSQSSSPTIAGHRAEVIFRNSSKNDCTTAPIAKNTYDGSNSPRTPDIIPRKHLELSGNMDTTPSPITQLAMKLERVSLDSHSSTSTPVQQSVQPRRNSESDDSTDGSGDNFNKRVSKSALENISKAGTTQHFSFSKNFNNLPLANIAINGNSSSSCGSIDLNQAANNAIGTKQVGVIRPLVSEPKIQTEISKSNDLDFAVDELSAKNRDNLVITNLSLTNTSSNRTSPQPTEKPALTSREIEKNLINEKKNEQANLESVAVKWQLGKKKPWSSQMAPSQNNCMVFNFKDRKEVPDYIENDGLIFKRRRELPKPNEPGFVLLGDLSLETSTDPDDSWTMGPPSPCDVEFENANILIDGKSSIRFRSRDASLRVQFDDTLTSTFEYPSESSLLDDSIQSENSNNKEPADHITVEEIIQIPSPKLLGNVSLGSAPLSSYTPVKAPLDTNFELGVTRAPTSTPPETLPEHSVLNANGTSSNCDMQMSINESSDIFDPLQNGNINQPDSLPYLKPATDDLTVAYSEGADKADLLY